MSENSDESDLIDLPPTEDALCVPVEFTFVVDVSKSMRRWDVQSENATKSRIDIVFHECCNFVRKQRVVWPNDRYSFIRFNAEAQILWQNKTADEALRALEDGISGSPAHGTNYGSGLKELLTLKSQAFHMRVVFLSDGRPCEWCSKTLNKFQSMWLPELQASRPSVEIHCIGFGPNTSDFEILQQISTLARGITHIAGRNARALQHGFTSISTRISDTRGAIAETPVVRKLCLVPPPRGKKSQKRKHTLPLFCTQFQFAWDPVEDVQEIFSEKVNMMRAAKPYMKGRMRYIYDFWPGCDVKCRMVAKETVFTTTTEAEEQCFVKSSACTQYYASMFCKRSAQDVSVLPCFLYRIEEKTDLAMEWFCGEEFIPGVFVKWISNGGYVSDLPETSVLASFVHFSYHESNGQHMVSDLQGVFNGRYTLTDPQILSADRSFGHADLGLEAMQKFLASHQCDEVCRRLNLPAVCTRHTLQEFVAPIDSDISSARLRHSETSRNVEACSLFKPKMLFVGESSLGFSTAAADLYSLKGHTPIEKWVLTERCWPSNMELDWNISYLCDTYQDTVRIFYPESVDATDTTSLLQICDVGFDACMWSMPYPASYSPACPLEANASAEMIRRAREFVRAASPLIKPVDGCISIVLVSMEHVECELREPIETSHYGTWFPEVHTFCLEDLFVRRYVPRFDSCGSYPPCDAVVVSWRRSVGTSVL